MSRRFRVDDAVWGELRDAVNWYEEQRGLGNEVLDVVERASMRFSKHRSAGRCGKTIVGTGGECCSAFPYSIFYVVDLDAVIVVALAHDKRRLGYWLG